MHHQLPPRVRHSLLTTVALTSLAIAAPATAQTVILTKAIMGDSGLGIVAS